MRSIVTGSARQVFRNERREPSIGIMVKTVCSVEATVEASGVSGCDIPIPTRMN
jgi:hypothetical protein